MAKDWADEAAGRIQDYTVKTFQAAQRGRILSGDKEMS